MGKHYLTLVDIHIFPQRYSSLNVDDAKDSVKVFTQSVLSTTLFILTAMVLILVN